MNSFAHRLQFLSFLLFFCILCFGNVILCILSLGFFFGHFFGNYFLGILSLDIIFRAFCLRTFFFGYFFLGIFFRAFCLWIFFFGYFFSDILWFGHFFFGYFTQESYENVKKISKTSKNITSKI